MIGKLFKKGDCCFKQPGAQFVKVLMFELRIIGDQAEIFLHRIMGQSIAVFGLFLSCFELPVVTRDHDKADGQKDAFVLVPAGSCEKLVGGSTESA